MHAHLMALGSTVEGHEHHRWRGHNLVALLSAQPTMAVLRVSVYGNIDLVIQKGAPKVMIAGESEQAIRGIEQSLVMGTLRVRQIARNEVSSGADWQKSRERWSKGVPRVVVALSLPEVPVVQHNGLGDVFVYDVDQEDLALGMVGRGDIHAFGSVSATVAALSGEGSIDLSGLESKLVVANLSGSGRIRVKTAERITGTLSEAGCLQVMGCGLLVDVRVAGQGKVEYC